MRTLARACYEQARLGVDCELPHAGSPLEIPLVYDASARELKDFACQGLVQIVEEQCARVGEEVLVDKLRFRRLR